MRLMLHRPQTFAARIIAATALVFAVTTPAQSAPPQRAGNHSAAAAPARAPRDWSTTVAVLPGGSHLIGNPAAKVKLVEYMSYTCPHCAHFSQATQAPLRGYLRSGKVAVEIRNLVRDPVDLAAAMLTNCGDRTRFVGNHDLLLATQDRWITTMSKSTDDQRKRWDTGALPARLQAIAADFGFYPLIAGRGYTRASADGCLSDKALLDRLVAQTEGAEKVGVNATPSFLINGALTPVHDWASLEPLIKAAL